MSKELNVYVTTFNCGRSLIDVDYFAAHLFPQTLDLPPDLLVLCLEETAPIAYSFLGGSLLAPYFARFQSAVQVAIGHRFGGQDGGYGSVVVRNVGMTALIVLAKEGVEERIRWVETAGVGVGVWEMGNKGAVAARIALNSEGDSSVREGEQEVVATFVAAHLTPMENACARRNEDWKSICEGLVFERTQRGETRAQNVKNGGEETEPLLASSSTERNEQQQQHTLFTPLTHLFFAGDLNYRTSDTSPDPTDYKTWPQPHDSAAYTRLLTKDQLTRERKANRTLHHLSEAEIEFPPTYKYSSLAQKKAAARAAAAIASKASSPDQEMDEDESDGLWAKHRIPSWCDRILYLTAAPPTVHTYKALPVQPTSDHRPVTLSFSVPLKSLDTQALVADDVRPPFATRKDWREARAVARRWEVVVGVAAYLALTLEGEMLLGGTVVGLIGGYLALKALLGGM